MSRIKILPENLANQIAAGEVVERPASVVKELVENAIDAGAANLSIQVEGGTTSLIRVIDDGGGMDQDDILLCLERHATSKISSVEELETIKTLGFRGEAIPSIASVSRMSITSRTADSSLGCRVELRFGKVMKVHEMGCQRGTVVEVRDLFGNVPARKKFLKTTRTELAHIDDVVKSYGLVCPDIALKYSVSGREAFAHPAAGITGLQSRVRQILGLAEKDALLELAYDGGGTELKVSGFVLPPDQPHGPAARLRAFVNGRPVRDRLITHAVAEGMRNFLMIGRLPAGVIYLDLPADVIDVNVHPTKQEVRFHKTGQVHQVIVAAVGQALLNYQRGLKEAVFGSGRNREVVRVHGPGSAEGVPYVNRPEQERVGLFSRDLPPRICGTMEKGLCPPVLSEPGLPSSDAKDPGKPDPGPDGHADETLQRFCPEAEARSVPLAAAKGRLGQLKVIGQLFDSYILCEGKDGLVAIDQHAAQERLIFERLKSQLSSGRLVSQALMFPKTIEFGAEEIAVIEEEKEELARLGIEIGEFGGATYVLKEIPAILAHLPPEEVLSGLLQQLSGDGTLKGSRVGVDSLLAGMACKAAVKANHPLQPTELESLLKEMLENDVFSHCPHGRPVMRVFSTDDIRKWFYRT